MMSEGFTKEEIVEWMKRVEDSNQYLMNKTRIRFMMGKEKRLMCTAFEHWVKWNRIKRLFKFYLNYCNDIV